MMNLTKKLHIWLDGCKKPMFGFDSDYVSDTICQYGCWEPQITHKFIELVKSGDHDHFIDIGAYIGYYSILWNSFCKQESTLLAVEANPYVYPLLCSNVGTANCLNGFAEQTGYGFTALACDNQTNLGAARRCQRKAVFSVQNISIRCSSVNTLVKIDAEGSELPILQSLLLDSPVHPRTIICEVTPLIDKKEVKSALSLLRNSGYSLYDLGCQERGKFLGNCSETPIKTPEQVLRKKQTNVVAVR